MIIGTFLALILNFSTVGHGGGVRLILAYEAHGFTSILEKSTFSRLREGCSWD
eukprot:UN21421